MARQLHLKLPPELVEYWDQVVTRDLNALKSTFQAWTEEKAYTRNTSGPKGGFLRGNLIAEFSRSLQQRLLSSPHEATIESDDPDLKENADKYGIVANSLYRLSNIQAAVEDAVLAGLWSTGGWIEVGHPMDPNLLDPQRSIAAPRAIIGDTFQDEWAPVGQVPDFGDQQIEDMDPFDMGNVAEEPAVRPVLGDMEYGYPFVISVDPRLIVFPHRAADLSQCDYVARLRFLTKQELKSVTGIELPQECSTPTSALDIHFDMIEGKEKIYYPDMVCVVDFYLRRERNNPEYNNWFCRWVLGHAKYEIYNGPNPWKSLFPLERVSLQKEKHMTDTTLSYELRELAELFDLAMQGLGVGIKDQINQKFLTQKNAGLDKSDKAKLTDPNYKGEIQVADVNAVKPFERPFRRELFDALTFLRSAAQGVTQESDMERGQAIKSITAEQTRALLTATGQRVDSMKAPIEKASANILKKAMYLLGMFGMNRDRRFEHGGYEVNLDRGTSDFTTSYLYKIQIYDTGSPESESDLLLFIQFLRQLSTPTGQMLAAQFDPHALASIAARKFKVTSALLPYQPPKTMPGQPGQSQIPLVPPGDQLPLGVRDQVEGQHPERTTGDRGIDVGNALRGGMKTGS